MNAVQFGGALALSLAACGEKQNAPQNREVAAGSSQPTVAAQVYSGTGTIQSITGDQVAIAHGPIQGIGWPAMTMTFRAPPDIAEGASPGAQVHFSFRQDGGSYVLTSLRPR